MQDNILAVVGNVNITEADLNAVIAKYPPQNRGYFETAEGRSQLLEQVIAFELMNNLGKEMKLNETDEYKVNLAAVEKDLLTQMAISKVLSEVTITDEEALKFYNENKANYVEAQTVSAKHILVDSVEKCNEIKNEINSGALSFEEAAMRYSSCPSKDQGGNLGPFGKGMMVPEFEKVAFELELEEVSEPVQTQFGYHLIKVEAKSEASEQTFEAVKEQIVNQLIQQQQERKYVDVISQLEARYPVTRK